MNDNEHRDPVGLVRCDSYERAALDHALRLAIGEAGFPDIQGKTVLVKPNVLNASAPDKAVTTHPEFVAAVIRLVKERGAARVLVGDSPAWQGGAMAARTAGIHDAAYECGAEWVEFAPGAPRLARGASLVKSFTLAAIVEECDLIINVPKLKTHRLMTYTGAVKNLFGLVPGIAKSAMHMRFPDKKRFGAMLVDLLGALPETYTLMDGIVSMEGEGPGSGDPVHTGIMLASGDAAAVDWIAAQCIGYDPRKIPYLVDALERTGRKPEVSSVGTSPLRVDDVKATEFKTLPYGVAWASTTSGLPSFAKPLIQTFLIDRPIFDPDICIGCKGCVKLCPAAALELVKLSDGRNQVRIDDKACITCFCCHEVCPVRAISIGRAMVRMPRERKRK